LEASEKSIEGGKAVNLDELFGSINEFNNISKKCQTILYKLKSNTGGDREF